MPAPWTGQPWTGQPQAGQPTPGTPSPLGAHHDGLGASFAVPAAGAEQVDVCLFDEQGREHRVPLQERTHGVWHGYLAGVPVGTRYGYRVDGPWDPDRGLRFNPSKLLLDPYARAIDGTLIHHDATHGFAAGAAPTGDEPDQDEPDRDEPDRDEPDRDDPARDDPARNDPARNDSARDDQRQDHRDSAPYVPRSVVLAASTVDTGIRPGIPWPDTVVYELHVKGFTATHPEIPPHLRGTYAGLAHPAAVEHLVGLGVTTVELLPVQHHVTEPHLARRGLTNYWGYNTLGFFAPHAGYSASGSRGQQVGEFRAMVRELHAAGIEVVLDVVYNHTAEGDRSGRTLSWRGLDNLAWYRTPADDRSGYLDTTGCGNTLDASRAAGLALVMDSLRYWVTEMGVDGFRFDLATSLARGTGGAWDPHAPFLTVVAQDPVISNVKLIAEPWDLGADGYQVGGFPSPWSEWNGRYRDDVRDFWRGTGTVRSLADRLSGSADLYRGSGRHPWCSINLVTCHDGFTLADLTSYQAKRNLANGEDNRDGTDDNRSWTGGTDGPTDDPVLAELRRRQARSLLATLVLSTGVPMLSMGDERGRTQQGNNNAYCQDNDVSYLDWSNDPAAEDLTAVVRRLLELRREYPTLRRAMFFDGLPAVDGGSKDLAWLTVDGVELEQPDWHDDDATTLGMLLAGDGTRRRDRHGRRQVGETLLVWLHAGDEPVVVTMPGRPWASSWLPLLDTADAEGLPVDPGPHVAGRDVALAARSVLVLRARD